MTGLPLLDAITEAYSRETAKRVDRLITTGEDVKTPLLDALEEIICGDEFDDEDYGDEFVDEWEEEE